MCSTSEVVKIYFNNKHTNKQTKEKINTYDVYGADN